MLEKVKNVKFKSNEDFYEFVDILRLSLIAENFLEASQELNIILNEMTYTTSSEMLGEIKLALLKLKENKNELSKDLTENVNLCLTTIENTFN